VSVLGSIAVCGPRGHLVVVGRVTLGVAAITDLDICNAIVASSVLEDRVGSLICVDMAIENNIGLVLIEQRLKKIASSLTPGTRRGDLCSSYRKGSASERRPKELRCDRLKKGR